MANVTPDCKIYVLNFQADDLTQYNIVRGWLRDSPLIESAMTPIGIVYFFKSYREVWELVAAMNFMFPNGYFTISKIDPITIDGNMPMHVWKWFDDNNDDNVNEIKPLRRNPNLLTIKGM